MTMETLALETDVQVAVWLSIIVETASSLPQRPVMTVIQTKMTDVHKPAHKKQDLLVKILLPFVCRFAETAKS